MTDKGFEAYWERETALRGVHPDDKTIAENAWAAASALLLGEPVAWQWRLTGDEWHVIDRLPKATGELEVRPLYTAPPAPACSVPDGWQAGLWRYGFTNEAFGLMNNGPYVLLEQVEMALLAAAPKHDLTEEAANDGKN